MPDPNIKIRISTESDGRGLDKAKDSVRNLREGIKGLAYEIPVIGPLLSRMMNPVAAAFTLVSIAIKHSIDAVRDMQDTLRGVGPVVASHLVDIRKEVENLQTASETFEKQFQKMMKGKDGPVDQIDNFAKGINRAVDALNALSQARDEVAKAAIDSRTDLTDEQKGAAKKAIDARAQLRTVSRGIQAGDQIRGRLTSAWEATAMAQGPLRDDVDRAQAKLEDATKREATLINREKQLAAELNALQEEKARLRAKGTIEALSEVIGIDRALSTKLPALGAVRAALPGAKGARISAGETLKQAQDRLTANYTTNVALGQRLTEANEDKFYGPAAAGAALMPFADANLMDGMTGKPNARRSNLPDWVLRQRFTATTGSFRMPDNGPVNALPAEVRAMGSDIVNLLMAVRKEVADIRTNVKSMRNP